MHEFTFKVTLVTDTWAHARQVMGERLGYDEALEDDDGVEFDYHFNDHRLAGPPPYFFRVECSRLGEGQMFVLPGEWQHFCEWVGDADEAEEIAEQLQAADYGHEVWTEEGTRYQRCFRKRQAGT